MMIACLDLAAQTSPDVNFPVKTKPFHIGLSYFYMNLDMKVHDMSIASVWQGIDFGTNELTGEEIDQINSFTRRNSLLNGIIAEAGIQLFSSPENKWSADGSLMAGVGSSFTETYNETTDTNDMEIRTGFTRPVFGIGMNVCHRFSNTWGIMLKPMAMVTFGKSDEISDNVYHEVENFTGVREDQAFTVYGRISLMACYTTGNFMISAGPGFYYARTTHDYTITRTNNSNGEILLDELNTVLVPRSFLDGVANLEWNFTEPFSLHVQVSAGQDITAKAGIFYRF